MHFLPTSLVFLLFAGTALAKVSTTIVTMTAPPVPASTSYTSDQDFQNDILAATNFYRSEHGVAPLTWNATSAKYAADWSSNCNFVHSGGPTGENLAAGYANASASVDAWGLEREQYNWAKPGFSETTGHFTQLVWGNTTTVGCGRTNCANKNKTPGWYVVCEYYPPGNIEGDNNQYFVANVPKQVKGEKSDTVESGVTSSGTGWRDAQWGVGVLCVAGVVGLSMTY
ncbi:PR-1-like protein [Stipitochalara longipes BDJ]|nr:PR-1-like protein [Stipitochalara longipes BDJ]